MAGLNISSEPGVDWGQVAQAVGLSSRIQADDEAAKVNAIRWQGQQDYQALVESGVTPEDALRRTAHKLYFNEPSGVASLLRATKPETAWEPSEKVVGGRRGLMTSPNSIIYPPEEKAPIGLDNTIEAGEGTVYDIIGGKPYRRPSKKETEDGLSDIERLKLFAQIPGLRKSIQDMDPTSQDFSSASNVIAQIEAALAPKTAPGSSVKPQQSIPGAAIQALRANPERAAEFDQMFGAGSAAQFLKK